MGPCSRSREQRSAGRKRLRPRPSPRQSRHRQSPAIARQMQRPGAHEALLPPWPRPCRSRPPRAAAR
eukprot:7648417-Lingulodinium_polyedra.AAC.1